MQSTILLLCSCLLLCQAYFWNNDPESRTAQLPEEQPPATDVHADHSGTQAGMPSADQNSSLQRSIAGIGQEIVVTDEEMKAFLDSAKEDDIFLIKFYAQWCPFSQQIEPVYSAVAKAFPTLPVFSLDASKYSSLNYRYGIYGFPKLLLFSGNDSTYRKYHGNRTFESISEFVKNATKLEPLPDVHVQLPPLGRATPEADIYLYLSSLFLFALFAHSLYMAWRLHAQSPLEFPHSILTLLGLRQRETSAAPHDKTE